MRAGSGHIKHPGRTVCQRIPVSTVVTIVDMKLVSLLAAIHTTNSTSRKATNKMMSSTSAMVDIS